MRVNTVVDEAEIAHALKELGHTNIIKRNGFTLYQDPRYPAVPVVLDHSKGPILYGVLLTLLEIQGINVDALCAYLED